MGPALIGAGLFLLLHVFFALTWDRLFQPARLEVPWFLGSPASLVVTQVATGVVAAVLAIRRSSWRERLRDAALTLAGVMAAAAALFFAVGPARLMVGPPHLWPVVLVSVLLLLTPAILAGTLLGGFLWRFQK